MFPMMQPSMEEDHEARSAMHELFRAEEIKESGPDLLKRIGDEIDRKVGILSRIRSDLPHIIDIEEDEEEDQPELGSSSFEDFLTRIRQKEDMEAIKTNETPAARRRRIKGN